MIVVDSSAWIEMLRKTASPVHLTLKRLIVEDPDELAITDVVWMELLMGAATKAQRSDVDVLAGRLRSLRLGGRADFERGAEIFRTCRANAFTPRRIQDLMIAVCAMKVRAPILHADRDFDRIASCTDLQVYPLD